VIPSHIADKCPVHAERLNAFRARFAALSQSPAAEAVVPEGWKLVPIKPTREMSDAGKHYLRGTEEVFERVLAEHVYNVMLTAAPNKPAAIEPVASQAIDLSKLRRFACFEIEDGIYEHQSVSYVLFRDVEALLASQPSQPAAGAQGDAVLIPIAKLEEWHNDLSLHGVGDIQAAQDIELYAGSHAPALESAQPIEQKPAAWRFPKSGNDGKEFYYFDSIPENANRKDLMQPLYTAPQRSTTDSDVRDAALLELDVLLAKFHAAVWEAASNEDNRLCYDEAGVEEAKAIQAHVKAMVQP
jgi:hypothetical protein